MNNLLSMLFSANGRIRRLHFWLSRLGVSIGWVLSLIIVALPMMAFKQPPAALVTIFCLYFLVSIGVVVWIEINLLIKRWHDRDKPGVWCLMIFVPFIGWLWVLIECGFMDGTQGPNQFGPSPKGIGAPAAVF